MVDDPSTIIDQISSFLDQCSDPFRFALCVLERKLGFLSATQNNTSSVVESNGGSSIASEASQPDDEGPDDESENESDSDSLSDTLSEGAKEVGQSIGFCYAMHCP